MSAHCVATVDSQFAVLDSPAIAALFDPSTDTTPADLTAYQRLVGALTFISRDRHDITKMVHVHARAAKAPTKGDLDKVIVETRTEFL